MTIFVLRRLGQGVITLAILSAIVFVMSRATGDPLAIMLPIDAPQELHDRMASQLGLDRSWFEQYVIYIGDLFQGDLGESIRYRTPVSELFFERFPNSVRLIVPAFVVACGLAVPLGVVSATTHRRYVDRILTVLVTLALAAPVFWLGITLIFVFSVQLGILPSSRMGGWDHYVLPVATLALFLTAGIMRLVRSSMLDAMGGEYIKLARLKGISEQRVTWVHALRNSLTAAVAFLGVYFSTLITGSVIIETVFAWPGSGRLLYEGIVNRDYPLVQGVILYSAAIVVVVNLVFDILQAYLDPRVRL